MTKGNDGKGNIAERDEWQTPQQLWRDLHKIYDFTFDCCASKNNSKCFNWSDDFEKVKHNPKRTAWMNPPFSKAKEMFEHFFKAVPQGVAIYRCDNLETAIWQDIILKHADWIFIPKGRVCYEGMKGKGSRFPSALIGFNVDTPTNLKGKVMWLKKNK